MKVIKVYITKKLLIKLEKQNINNLNDANKTHNKVGREVRNTMKKLSGITPEELPTPKSIKKLEENDFISLDTK